MGMHIHHMVLSLIILELRQRGHKTEAQTRGSGSPVRVELKAGPLPAAAPHPPSLSSTLLSAPGPDSGGSSWRVPPVESPGGTEERGDGALSLLFLSDTKRVL